MNVQATLYITFAGVSLIVAPCAGQEKIEPRDVLLAQRRRVLNDKALIINGGELRFMGGFRPSANAANAAEAAADQYRQRLNRFMAVRVDEVRRVCQPSAGQLKRIEVAAKGAVEQAMRKWQNTTALAQAQPLILRRGRVLGFAGGGGVGNVEVVDRFVPPVVELEAPARGGGAVVIPKAAPMPPVAAAVPLDPPLAPGARPPNVQPQVPFAQPTVNASFDAVSVERELVWRKTLRRVLTDEQKDSFRRAVAERRDRKEDATSDSVVELLDHQLLLSGSQREQLATVIEQRLGKQKLEMLLSVNQQADAQAGQADAAAMQNAHGRVLTYITQRIPSSLVGGQILTAPQVAWWNELRTGRGPILVPAKDDATRVTIESLEDEPPSP